MFCRNPANKWQRLPAAATRQDAASTIWGGTEKFSGHCKSRMNLNIKRDSSHSFGMTNDAVISTEGGNLLRQESLSFPELLSRYLEVYHLKKSGEE